MLCYCPVHDTLRMFAQDDDDDDANELLHMRKACMGTLNLFARCCLFSHAH